MKVIFKYPFYVTNAQQLWMPEGAKPLCVQVQDGSPQMWALVDQYADQKIYTFRVYGTGNPLPNDNPGEYIDTFQLDGFVWHVFQAEA